MDITPKEAEEALEAIQVMVRKTRHSISSSGAYMFLIVWGVIWLLGFLGSQFLPVAIGGYSWIILDVLGGILSAVIGIRMGRSVRSSAPTASGKRIGIFWLLLFVYGMATVAVSWPADGKQLSMYIILIVMVGWMAMGLLLSFTNILPGLLITALALISYFLLPDIFYLVMAILGGGGMIVLGLYIRNRW